MGVMDLVRHGRPAQVHRLTGTRPKGKDRGTHRDLPGEAGAGASGSWASRLSDRRRKPVENQGPGPGQ